MRGRERENTVKIHAEGVVNVPVAKASGEEQKNGPSFASVLNNSLKEKEPGERTNDYTKNEALNYAARTEGYADGLMNSFINDIGGPLLDYSDPDVVRFSRSGELVTPDAMIYYREQNDSAKQNYREIYEAGKANGDSTERIFEKFLDYNASLPARYKGMANLSF